MEPFATIDELQDRLDFPLDDTNTTVAEAALEDASELARFYGRDWESAAAAPRPVRTIVLRACVRYMKNPEGYTQSRAGDETVVWDADRTNASGAVELNAEEIKMLGLLAGKTSTVSSAPVSVWGPQFRGRPEDYRRHRHHRGYVPVTGAGKGFPMFTRDDSPWDD